MAEVEVHMGMTLQLESDTNQYGRVDATLRRTTKGDSKEEVERTFASSWQMVERELAKKVRELQKAFNTAIAEDEDA